MAIDPATRASLEIDRSPAPATRDGSLLAAIDRTRHRARRAAAGRRGSPGRCCDPGGHRRPPGRGRLVLERPRPAPRPARRAEGPGRHGARRCRAWRWAAAGRATWAACATAWRPARPSAGLFAETRDPLVSAAGRGRRRRWRRLDLADARTWPSSATCWPTGLGRRPAGAGPGRRLRGRRASGPNSTRPAPCATTAAG